MNELAKSVEAAALPESTISPPAGSVTGVAVTVLEEVNQRIGRRRWLICALLFFAATINYIDRQVFSILAPVLQAIGRKLSP